MKKLKAFTVIELVVAMVITGLVLAFAYMGYSFVLKYFREYKNSKELINKAISLSSVLTEDFDRAASIQYTEGVLTVERISERAAAVTYRIEPSYILREEQDVRDTFPFPAAGIYCALLGTETVAGFIDEMSFSGKVLGEDETFHFRKRYSAEELMRIENNDGLY